MTLFKRAVTAALGLGIFVLFSSGSLIAETKAAETKAAETKTVETVQLTEASVDEVLAELDLREKALLTVGMGMRIFIPGMPQMAPEDAAIPDKVAGAAGRSHGIPRLGVPILTLADGPAGLRIDPTREDSERTYHATAFPIASLLASSWDLGLVREVGAAIGAEALEYGVDVLLAPGMNIQRHPLGGRNYEYYSEDPLVSGLMAAAYVEGVQSNGVGASIKHYVANSQEFNRMKLDTAVGERALREIYLRGFEIAVKQSQPWTTMSSYNLVNGTYTSESPELLTSVLRDEWGYDGLVVTDWFGGTNPVAQIAAGNDLLMPGLPEQSQAIVEAVKSGALDEKVLDVSVRRVLRMVQKSPTFRGVPYGDNPDFETAAGIARRAAAEGMVLLENSDDTLPLAAEQSVALLGNASYELLIGGTGSGEVHEAHAVNLQEGLVAAGHAVDTDLAGRYTAYIAEQRAKQPPRMPLFPVPPIEQMPLANGELEELAKSKDLAIFTVARPAGEFADRGEEEFELTSAERSLFESTSEAFRAEGKKVVVVLNVASAIEVVSWRHLADAVLLAWLPGQEGGHAVADVLGGAVNPSGRLAITFPKTLADIAASENFPGEVRNPGEPGGFLAMVLGVPADVRHEEGIYVGYRYHETFGVPAAYPFGYGLSYTDFEFGDLTVAENSGGWTATVAVKNVGDRAGKEVVQLYVAAPKGMTDKPRRELRAFGKTRELGPGEAETLTFELTPADLASFHPERSAWLTDAGTYQVEVGRSASSVAKRVPFDVAETQVIEEVHALTGPTEPIEDLRPSPVKTENGELVGSVLPSGVHTFRGIPYAEPPVGERRWRSPSPAPAWQGIRDARDFGPRCLQKPLFDDMRFRDPGLSEDCLHLNVWTPDPSPEEPLSVLVYFYGGGFLAGDGSEPRYDGESLAKRGIVSVTLNYRLGVFGFLSHPELAHESPHGNTGNYGLLDQRAALLWVQKHIASFGGDPSRVTIAGESAGSMSVSAHMASPISRGLFAGAIGQSGALLDPERVVARAEAEKRAQAFARSLGIESNSAESLEQLRALPAEDLLNAPVSPEAFPFSITVDGLLLPKAPLDVFAAGEQAPVPLLLGWNADELPGGALLGSAPVTPESFADAVRRIYGDRADELLAVYDADASTAERVASDLASDRFINYGAWKWFEMHRRSGQPVYRYLYAHPRPPVRPDAEIASPPLPGAAHAAEIEYALGNLHRNDVFAWTEDDHRVSEIMQRYFVAFIKTGAPNTADLPPWPAANSDGPSQILEIGTETRAVPEPHRERYQALEEIAGQ